MYSHHMRAAGFEWRETPIRCADVAAAAADVSVGAPSRISCLGRSHAWYLCKGDGEQWCASRWRAEVHEAA